MLLSLKVVKVGMAILIFMLKSSIILLLFSLVLLSEAWWDKGHMLTSQIAWNHLSDNNLPARDKFNALVLALNPFTDGKTQTFIQAAVWADDIKEHKVKIFDNYHFTNIVYDPEFRFNGMTQYQQDVNSINTINWCYKILKLNKNGLSFQRAWMARYLLHLVGDIHQPLHNTNFFNATYKTGDLGGNLIKVTTPEGKAMNLHAYFDSIAQDQDPYTNITRPLNDTFRAGLEAEARAIMAQYPASELQKQLSVKDPRAWGVESYRIAVDRIYSYTSSNSKITAEYQQEIREVLIKQIALGGYRLANAIADIYA